MKNEKALARKKSSRDLFVQSYRDGEACACNDKFFRVTGVQDTWSAKREQAVTMGKG